MHAQQTLMQGRVGRLTNIAFVKTVAESKGNGSWVQLGYALPHKLSLRGGGCAAAGAVPRVTEVSTSLLQCDFRPVPSCQVGGHFWHSIDVPLAGRDTAKAADYGQGRYILLVE